MMYNCKTVGSVWQEIHKLQTIWWLNLITISNMAVFVPFSLLNQKLKFKLILKHWSYLFTLKAQQLKSRVAFLVWMNVRCCFEIRLRKTWLSNSAKFSMHSNPGIEEPKINGMSDRKIIFVKVIYPQSSKVNFR